MEFVQLIAGIIVILLGLHLLGFWLLQFVFDLITQSVHSGDYGNWKKSNKTTPLQKLLGLALILSGIFLILS